MANHNPTAPAPLGYASRELTAERIGYSPKRLDQLVAEGWIPKADRGRYDQLAALQGVIAFHRDSARRANKGSADDELKRIRIRRELRKESIENGRLITAEEAVGVCDILGGQVSLHVNNIPARFTRDLALRERLQEHVDEALSAVADSLDECLAALRPPGGDHPPEAAADDDDGD